MLDYIDKVRSILAEKKELGILYLDTSFLQSVEIVLGWETFDKIIELIESFIADHKSLFYHWRITAFWKTLSDSFVLIIEPVQGEIVIENLEFLCVHIQNEVNSFLKRQQRYLPVHPVVQLGYAILRHNSNIRFERLMGKTIEEAHEIAKTCSQRDINFQIQKLKQIIEEKKIYMVFQPIVNLKTGACIGYEALARGPRGSPLEAPEVMFSLASKAGMVFQLEDVCKNKIISQFSVPENQLIFVNLEPALLESKAYKKLSLFEKSEGLKNRLVIEITERMAIKDFHSMDSTLKDIRSLGYMIAVDDVGSGYSSLETIAYLKPDFIKINYSLVSGIFKDFIKQEISKTLVDIARKIGAKTVAEGIETLNDLACVRSLDIDYGQGFYISYPNSYPEKVKINIKPWKLSKMFKEE